MASYAQVCTSMQCTTAHRLIKGNSRISNDFQHQKLEHFLTYTPKVILSRKLTYLNARALFALSLSVSLSLNWWLLWYLMHFKRTARLFVAAIEMLFCCRCGCPRRPRPRRRCSCCCLLLVLLTVEAKLLMVVVVKSMVPLLLSSSLFCYCLTAFAFHCALLRSNYVCERQWTDMYDSLSKWERVEKITTNKQQLLHDTLYAQILCSTVYTFRLWF